MGSNVLTVDVEKGLGDFAITAKFEAIGFDVIASNGSQFTTFVADEISRWKTVIETGKITPDQ